MQAPWRSPPGARRPIGRSVRRSGARRLDRGPMPGLGCRLEDHADPGREARHLEQGEAQAARRQLVVTPAFELAPCGNRAHFVVDLGPAALTAAMAVPDECGDLRR